MQSGPATEPDPSTMRLGTIVAGRYRLHRLIGKGGFGAVFDAENLNEQRRVALKILSSSVLEMVGGADRFWREAELARRLSHPNIVRVLDAGTDPGGTLFIAFELLEGKPLDAEIHAHGALSLERTAAIGVQVASALEHAHAAGVVHRDLKPANVFLVRAAGSETAKLLDFGIAKSTNPGTRAGLTKDGTSLGTPAFMSPEQIMGGAVGPQTDLFSFGLVLAEMLYGRPLYDAHTSALAIINERISGARLTLPDVVARSPLAPVIAHATEPNVVQRTADARSMRLEIEAAARMSETLRSQGAVRPAPPVGPAPRMAPIVAPYPAPRAQGGGAGLAIFIVLLLAALGAIGGGVAWMLLRDDGTPSRPRDKRANADDDDEEDDSEDDDGKQGQGAKRKPDKPARDPQPVAPPQQPVSPTQPAVLGSVRACAGVGGLTVPALRGKLQAADMPIKGTLLYCAGDMINFVCKGPQGDGFTVDAGGAALFKLGGAPAAESFARSQAAAATKETIVAFGGGKVLSLEMPKANADRLLSGICP